MKNNKNNNVKVVTNNYDVELKISNFKEKFNVKHKMNKKDKLEVSIKDKSKEYKLTLKETKNKIKVKQLKVIEDIKGENKETLVSLDKIEYIDDFEIKVRDFYVPITVLLNPVLELYYDSKKIDTEMKANKGRVSMKKGKYTVDCTVRKEDYMIETSVLSLDELKELYDENDDNKLGIYLEFLKRNHEQEGDIEDMNKDNIGKEENINTKLIEEIMNKNKTQIDELNKKHEEEMKALQEKYMKEMEELKSKINKELEEKKAENKLINEIKDETIVDSICCIFENAGKKDLFISKYEAYKGNDFNKVISEIIAADKKLLDPVLTILDDKISNNKQKEEATKLKNTINDLVKSKNNMDLLYSAAKGTFDNFDENIMERVYAFSSKIKELNIKPSDEEIIKVLSKYETIYMAEILLADVKEAIA